MDDVQFKIIRAERYRRLLDDLLAICESFSPKIAFIQKTLMKSDGDEKSNILKKCPDLNVEVNKVMEQFENEKKRVKKYIRRIEKLITYYISGKKPRKYIQKLLTEKIDYLAAVKNILLGHRCVQNIDQSEADKRKRKYKRKRCRRLFVNYPKLVKALNELQFTVECLKEEIDLVNDEISSTSTYC